MHHRWISLLLSLCLLSGYSLVWGESCGDPIHCTPPQFYDELPADGASVTALDHVEITAAPDANISHVEFVVGGTAYQPVATALRSGAHRLTLAMPDPVQKTGPVVVRVTAQNRVGECWGMKAWIINIR